jgi:CxxC motif-containing protein (DUF1111 family)
MLSMRGPGFTRRPRLFSLAASSLVLVLVVVAGAGAFADPPPAPDGRELFNREWLPGDSRSHGGDGLGPVFNDTSCGACHNQGGIGGAGPRDKNVDIITAFKSARPELETSGGVVKFMVRSIFGGLGKRQRQARKEAAVAAEEARAEAIREERDRLAAIHPGFRSQRSVVLHQFGAAPEYNAWRARLSGIDHVGMALASVGAERGSDLSGAVEPAKLSFEQERELQLRRAHAQFGGALFFNQPEIDGFAFLTSQRNPIALFGSGLIDRIPAAAIEEAAGKKHEGFPEIRGRVARLKDGRIGRFGWKAQEATLDDFVRTACAVELGLHVPGRPQAGSPQKPEYHAPGEDLVEAEVGALVSYIAQLPRPSVLRPAAERELSHLDTGKAQFAKIGCAACHAPDLGGVEGIYSDLLLHNLGPELGDQGNYGAFAPDRTEAEENAEPLATLEPHAFSPFGNRLVDVEEARDRIGASRLEWRTPPLWGLRDSAPYLHDGRARDLDDAIALHGGEGERSARMYFALENDERLAVKSFLRSLTAP